MASKTVSKDLLSENIDRMIKELPDILDDAYSYFRNITPIDTGNARRKTKQEADGDIDLDYDYATFLDEGSSDQAPLGMTEPTSDYLDSEFKEWVRKHG